MKAILRNFITVLARFKMASTLNIIGLSVAFAAFMIIMSQVRYETGFDKFHSKTGQIYRVEISWDSTSFQVFMPRPMINVARDASPSVEYGSYVDEYAFMNAYISVERDGSYTGFQETAMRVYPDFVHIFDFDLTEGQLSAFSEPNAVVIPESIAERFFGGEPALGRPLKIRFDRDTTLYVAGVYRDFPLNTWIRNCVYVAQNPDLITNPAREGWEDARQSLFVQLTAGADPDAVARQMIEAVDRATGRPEWRVLKNLRLVPVEEMYYDKTAAFDSTPKGSHAITRTLFAIAILIIVIAGINFVNFSTSLTPLRMKSLNTRKVLGSSVSTLRMALVFEAMGTAVIAYAFSLLWLYVIEEFNLMSFFTSDVSLGANIPIVLFTALVAVVVGAVAGLYPAFYATSFPPALVLKGSFGLSPKGRRLQTALIGFQFVVSIGLIIVALFMQIQNDFMRRMDKGLNAEQAAVAVLNKDLVVTNRSTLESRLKDSPYITEVGFALHPLGATDFVSTISRPDNEGNKISLDVVGVSWTLPEMLDIAVIDGRSFTEEDSRRNGVSYLINETASKAYNLGVGDVFRSWDDGDHRIIGITEDFNYRSLRTGIGPFAFVVNDGFMSPWMSAMYVNVSGDPHAAVNHIKKSIASIDPTFPANIQFYDAYFDYTYDKERKTTTQITVFSLLAVVISLMGVFGLVVFETQYRRKEIGVRKVFGASANEVLRMFNRSFIIIVGVCFVIAVPVAYIGVSGWLRNFAYRTPLYWWVFVLALALVACVTFVTVTVQSWRAATDNPVNAIKND